MEVCLKEASQDPTSSASGWRSLNESWKTCTKGKRKSRRRTSACHQNKEARLLLADHAGRLRGALAPLRSMPTPCPQYKKTRGRIVIYLGAIPIHEMVYGHCGTNAGRPWRVKISINLNRLFFKMGGSWRLRLDKGRRRHNIHLEKYNLSTWNSPRDHNGQRITIHIEKV